MILGEGRRICAFGCLCTRLPWFYFKENSPFEAYAEGSVAWRAVRNMPEFRGRESSADELGERRAKLCAAITLKETPRNPAWHADADVSVLA